MLSESGQRKQAKECAEKIVRILDSKKAAELRMICVREITPLADYFVICTANSSTQLHSLADEVEFIMKEKHNTEPRGVEGRDGWILLDYSSVIVHVFTKDAREFYKLDKLWADGVETDLSEIIETEDNGDENK